MLQNFAVPIYVCRLLLDKFSKEKGKSLCVCRKELHLLDLFELSIRQFSILTMTDEICFIFYSISNVESWKNPFKI